MTMIHVRRWLGLVLGIVTAFSVMAVTAAPGGAGGDITMTIEKVVVGDVDPGASFVIDLNCGEAPDVGGAQVTFDAQGNPVPAGGNVVQWTSIPAGAFDCSPTEQAVDDVDATYSCAAAGAVECDAVGPQAAPIVVGMNGTGTVTVTVTNTAVATPPASTPVDVAPVFTG